MRVPSEKETRKFFERIGYFLAPIASGRQPESVLLYADRLGSMRYFSAPTLRHLWQQWAEIAIEVRQESEQADALVACWMAGAPQVKQHMERWLEKGASEAWPLQYASLARSVPSRSLTISRLPRNWRAQLLLDVQVRNREGALSRERIQNRIRALKADAAHEGANRQGG